MKKISTLLMVLLFASFAIAQNNKLKKVEKIGKDLYEVTIYYESGKMMQHGFFSKDFRLHAQWDSYNEDGTKSCVGFYNNGVKTGTWLYWNGDNRKRVTYKNNKIIKVEELDSLN